MRTITSILILAIVTSLTFASVASQSYTSVTSSVISANTQLNTVTVGFSTLAALTTSAVDPNTGTIPPAYIGASGLWVCFYFPYQLHVDSSIKGIVGTISANSPVNLYVMSKLQYDQFVAYNPPCGSSYISLLTEYSTRSYLLQWTPPQPDDYYILIQNTSQSIISYSIQLSKIVNQQSTIYSTSTNIQLFTLFQTLTESVQTSQAPQSGLLQSTLPIVIGIVVIVGISIMLIRAKQKNG